VYQKARGIDEYMAISNTQTIVANIVNAISISEAVWDCIIIPGGSGSRKTRLPFCTWCQPIWKLEKNHSNIMEQQTDIRWQWCHPSRANERTIAIQLVMLLCTSRSI